MKTATKIIIVLFAIIVTRFLVSVLFFFTIAEYNKNPLLLQVLEAAIAIVVGIFVWKKTKFTATTLGAHVFMV
ncbi:hypothetical protein [Daejeonella sp.]|uniref:hypothetical protein n=1 Tax=Daejeonella sp. TaxID=2805397 RepID=UPI0030C36E52